MSDDKTIIEAPAIGVRVEVQKLKGLVDAIQKLGEQHTLAIMDFGKAHNGHVMSTQRQVTYLAQVVDQQTQEIKILKDQVDMLLKRMTDKGLI